MTDAITLPRADAERIRAALASGEKLFAALAALDAALAEPEPTGKDSLTVGSGTVDAERYRWLRGEVQGPHTPLAQVVWKRNNIRESGDWTNLSGGQALDEAIDAALAGPEPVHPGYVIGSHWLETAYSRIAAGEAEADVLAEVLGERGWVKREPATMKQISAAHRATIGAPWLDEFDRAWKAAEQFHGIRKEDK